GAAEARVVGTGFGVHPRGVFGGFVAPAGGRLGRGAGGVVAAIGIGELGEAVDPPVAGQGARGSARRRHVLAGVGAQPGQVGRRRGGVDGDGAGRTRGQRT